MKRIPPPNGPIFRFMNLALSSDTIITYSITAVLYKASQQTHLFFSDCKAAHSTTKADFSVTTV